MSKTTRRFSVCGLLGIVLYSSLLTLCAAQSDAAIRNYPNKPIRLIIPFAAGGGTDITARVVAKGISEVLGQPVVADNRSGGGGIIGADMVARAPADGYTLLMGATGTHTINPSLYANIPYDSVRDFEPVSLVTSSAYLMVVPASSPARSVQEFIALAKSKTDKLNMASSGVGGMPHLSGELFNMMAGIQMIHIPYKGTGAVFADLLAGHVDVLFADIVAAYPYIKSGRLRVLAITSPTRSPSLPDVPTIAEAGLPGYQAVGWFALFAPRGTPRPIITKLNAAVSKYLTGPAARNSLAGQGGEIIGGPPEKLADIIKSDLVRWSEVVKKSGARAE